jgi:WD40 repeat protein
MRLAPFRSLAVVAIVGALVLALALPAAAQGPPDIRWRGTHTNFVQAVAISPDGTLVASGSADRTTRIWRVSDGALVRTIVQCSGIGCRGPNALAFSPDGQVLAAAGSSLKLWRASDGTLVRTINVGLADVAYSPDGQTLVGTGAGSGYNNVFVHLIRVADGVITATFSAGGVGVAFSPDGSLVGAVGRRGFDLFTTDGKTLWHLDGARRAVAFSPDGGFLAIAGSGVGDYRYDDTIQLYAKKDGSLLRTMKRTGTVSALAFTSDGATLVSTGWDPNENFTNGFTDSTGTIRFWSMASEKPTIGPPPRVTYDGETGTGAGSVAIAPGNGAFVYAHGNELAFADFPDTSCVMSLSPDSVIVPRGGGSGSFEVSAPPSCGWSATSRVSWIIITGPDSGTGDGTVSFVVTDGTASSEKTGYDSIVGQITAAGQSFLVNLGGLGDGAASATSQ